MKESQVKTLLVIAIVFGLIALVFNIIGRFTEVKTDTESTTKSTRVEIPQNAKFNSPTPSVEDICLTHDCDKGKG